MKILLVTPPLTQLNTPYPASPYLAGFLEKCGYTVAQLDLGIMMIDRIFRKPFISSIFDEVAAANKESFEKVIDYKNFNNPPESCRRYLACRSRYEDTVEAVMRFLRGMDSSLAQRICTRMYLPEGSRFDRLGDLDLDFGKMGIHDRAVYLATLYIEDIADFIRDWVAPNFALIKYAEKLCLYLPEFDPLILELEKEPVNSIDRMMLDIFEEEFLKVNPQMVGFCVPFPGNLYGALKCSALLKKKYASVLTVMGGGYINTELRQLTDARLFDYIDFLTFDDGELPLERLVKGFLASDCSVEQLKIEASNHEQDLDSLIRTMFSFQDKIRTVQIDSVQNIPMANRGIPNYSGMPLSLYIDLTDVTNPMMRLWSNGKWNKFSLAHGCYWAKCAFCDTSLDYIARYESVSATILVDWMEAIMKQTGQSGFHFVDEAAPPVILKNLALEILRRGLQVTWWGNIRFEKSFTFDLCLLLAKSGCIAVSGGIEVASDRLLQKMNKGITLSSAANACYAFSEAGIMVHAYLMYGFPSQTVQETIDSLEIVRQLFSMGLIHSAFWHRFAMTVHSPVGTSPEKFGIKRTMDNANPFSNNETPFEDSVETDHDQFADGLRIATYNYMHGTGFDKKVFTWFNTRMPKTLYQPDIVDSYIGPKRAKSFLKSSRLIWLGDGLSLMSKENKYKKEVNYLTCYIEDDVEDISSEVNETSFAFELIKKANPKNSPFSFGEAEELYRNCTGNATVEMINAEVWETLAIFGLVVV